MEEIQTTRFYFTRSASFFDRNFYGPIIIYSGQSLASLGLSAMCRSLPWSRPRSTSSTSASIVRLTNGCQGDKVVTAREADVTRENDGTLAAVTECNNAAVNDDYAGDDGLNACRSKTYEGASLQNNIIEQRSCQSDNDYNIIS